MPQMEFHAEDINLLGRILKRPNGLLRRSRIWGWRVEPWSIKSLVEAGYLELIYDWSLDRPALRITSLGRARYEEETSRCFSRIRG